MLFRELIAPISVQIELTTKCSNNCLHCYNYQKQDNDPDIEMSSSDLLVVFKALREAEVFSVVITGGEPLLLSNLVVEAISLAKEYGIACSINTNLTVLTDGLAERMKKAGHFSVLTSIASNEEAMHDKMMDRKGAFQRTMNGISILKKYNLSFSANMVVTELNAHQVYQTGEFVHNLGASSFFATKASPPLGCSSYFKIQPTHEDVRKSLDDLQKINRDFEINVGYLECYPLCFLQDIAKFENFAKRKCSAGVSVVAIGPDGQVRPCSHSNRLYGNILSEDLITIYSRMSEWRTGELLPDKCIKCEYITKCTGGCRCEAEYAGNINGLDPYAGNPSEVVLPQNNHVNSRKIEINLDTIFSVKKAVKFRKESFGYVVWLNGATVFVDDEAGLLLKEAQNNKMSLSQAVLQFGSKADEISDILMSIVSKNMVRFG